MCVTARVGEAASDDPAACIGRCQLRTEIRILEGNDIGIYRPSRGRLNPDIRLPYFPNPGKRCALRDIELAGVRIPLPRPSTTELDPRV